MEDAPAIRLGRDICGDAGAAAAREWIVCNGLGGYASGTVSGQPTRGYHGLLVAALDAPPGRWLMLAALAEEVEVEGERHELATFAWTGGALAPQGHRLLESFRLEGDVPTWRYACGGALLEKRVWMEPGANLTRVEYALLHAAQPVRLRIKALVNHRDHHARTAAGSWEPEIRAEGDMAEVIAFPGATPLSLRAAGAEATPAREWYRGFDLARERERGLGDAEDHLHAATFTASLAPGATLQLTASAGPPAAPDPAALGRLRAREEGLLARFAAVQPAPAPAWVRQLVLAADQFLFIRRDGRGGEGHSVIAGYHWFADWGATP